MKGDGLRRRLRGASIGTVALLGVLGLRLVALQVAMPEAYGASAVDNALRLERIEPPRGRIVDRDGEVLADTRSTVDLVVHPDAVDDPEELRAELATLLDPAAMERVDDALASHGYDRHRGWAVARDLDPTLLARVAARRHLLDGTDITSGHLRTYPAGIAASHLVGYLTEVTREDLLRLDATRYRSGDRVGRHGLEQALEDTLRGEPGWTAWVADSLGREVQGDGPWRERLDAERAALETRAEPGADVVLTVDLDLQRAAAEALDGRPGAVVMIDVHTGAILAYESSPGFDPDELVRGVTRKRWGELQSDARKPMLDRIARGQYPPASTFKLATSVAALQAGVSPHRPIHCAGALQIGRRAYKCWRKGGHGTVDLLGALRGSCDVWFYVTGMELGPERIADAARALGLGPSTGFGLNGERGGNLPDPAWLRRRYGLPWTAGDTASAAIGQSIDLVTPLQLAVMTATVANGGSKVTPFVVQEVVAPDGTTVRLGGSEPPEPTDLPPEILAEVRAGMVAVIMDDHGTAKAQRIEGMPYAGKTGTAQSVSARLKKLRPGPETEDHALFVAYAPLDAPQVAIAAIVEHVGGGSRFAAPVARHVLETWARDQGLIPPAEEVE